MPLTEIVEEGRKIQQKLFIHDLKEDPDRYEAFAYGNVMLR
jgi:hypothetical protein